MKAILIFCLALLCQGLSAQTVIVNPDSTHSVIHDHGKTKVMVNPDGTHSVMIQNGKNQTWVHPHGTHSQVIDHGGNTKVIVNPDGTHTVVIKQGQSHHVIVNPDGTHTLTVKKGKTKTIIHPDGSITQTIRNSKNEKNWSVRPNLSTPSPPFSFKITTRLGPYMPFLKIIKSEHLYSRGVFFGGLHIPTGAMSPTESVGWRAPDPILT